MEIFPTCKFEVLHMRYVNMAFITPQVCVCLWERMLCVCKQIHPSHMEAPMMNCETGANCYYQRG